MGDGQGGVWLCTLPGPQDGPQHLAPCAAPLVCLGWPCCPRRHLPPPARFLSAKKQPEGCAEQSAGSLKEEHSGRDLNLGFWFRGGGSARGVPHAASVASSAGQGGDPRCWHGTPCSSFSDHVQAVCDAGVSLSLLDMDPMESGPSVPAASPSPAALHGRGRALTTRRAGSTTGMEVHGVWRPHSLLGRHRHHPGGRGAGAPEVSLSLGWGFRSHPGSWEGGALLPTLPLGPECSPVARAPTSVSLITPLLLCLQELNCNYFSVTVAALSYKC